MTVKIVLSEVREKRGITQEALAQALNISLRGVQYLEYSAKAIKVDLMDQICDVLNCTPGELYKKIDDDGDGGDRGVRSEQRERKSQMMQKYWAEKKREKNEEAAIA